MLEFGCCGWSVQIVRMTNLLVSVSDRAPEFSASILLGELNETLQLGIMSLWEQTHIIALSPY
jgi:hypothetical protein